MTGTVLSEDAGGGVRVITLNRPHRLNAIVPELLEDLIAALEATDRDPAARALVLTGDRTMRRLNSRFRGKHGATDVLAFGGAGDATGLGDVVISVETAARNARRLRRTLLEELDVLALHGFLHVLGYDHETDDGTMDRLERRLRRRLGLRP